MSPKGDFLLIVQDSAQVPFVTTILRRVRLLILLCLSKRRPDGTDLPLCSGGEQRKSVWRGVNAVPDLSFVK
jgi:hypothetical protein